MIIRYTLPQNPPKEFHTPLQTILVGRCSSSEQYIDLDLSPDLTVSQLHAQLSYENGSYWVEDLGSTNGTYVNGLRITGKTEICANAELEIGQTAIELLTDYPSHEEPVQYEPASEGFIEDIHETEWSAYDLGPRGEPVEQGEHDWYQLHAFYQISQALGTVTSLEQLLQILIEQLQAAIPAAQRGALLLPDERGELLLKAHWPLGYQSVSMTLVKKAFEERKAFIWQLPTKKSSSSVKPISLTYYQVKSAIYVPLLCSEQVLGVMYMDNYDDESAFSSADLEMLCAVANQVAFYIKEHTLRQDLHREELFRANLLRQFSPHIADQMSEQYNRLQLGGERMNPVTILMSDIRSFTTISATMKPDDVVRMLNEMFDAFVPIIFEYDGVIDKYIGDAVLAIFGSPEPDENQWVKAVSTALEMQNAVDNLSQGWQVRRLPVFSVGIGIHSGEVIHGFIGSSARMEYTVIGNTVNQTARMCDGAAPGEVVISQTVYERLYRRLDVETKTIRTKHPEHEKDFKVYVVKGMKKLG